MSTSFHGLDAADVAAVLGVSRRRVGELADVDDFPSAATTQGNRLWPPSLIERWAIRHPAQEDRGERPVLPSFGFLSPMAERVLALARDEAASLDHPWVGPEHVMLALARSDCPGPAKRVLESFGLALPELRSQLVAQFGDPFDPLDAEPAVPPVTFFLLLRANCEARRLQDEAVGTEHVLLAVVRDDVDRLLTPMQVDFNILRSRVLAVNERSVEPESWPDGPGSAPRPRPGDTLDLAVRADGLDPKRRRPWTYPILHDGLGRAIQNAEGYVHYAVDRDGFPVLTSGGQPVRQTRLADEHIDLGTREALEPFDPPLAGIITRSPASYSTVVTED